MTKLTEQFQAHQEELGSPGGFGRSPMRDGVAAVLAKRRDALGWKLTDIAATLRIRPEYLMALERGSLDGLPGPAYAMGFLRAYADYLGFDGKEIVHRFKAEQTSLNAKPELTFPMPLTQRGVPGSGLLVTALILVGLVYGTWYYLSSETSAPLPEVQPVPAALLPKLVPVPAHPPAPKPAVAAVSAPGGQAPATTAKPMPPALPNVAAAALPTAPPKPLAVAPPPAAAPAPAPNPVPSSRIVIAATATSWIQLSQNHKPIVTRMLQPGDQYPVPDQPGMSLWTGNAGGIHLIVDGQNLPPPGRLGQPIRHIPLDPKALLAPQRH